MNNKKTSMDGWVLVQIDEKLGMRDHRVQIKPMESPVENSVYVMHALDPSKMWFMAYRSKTTSDVSMIDQLHTQKKLV